MKTRHLPGGHRIEPSGVASSTKCGGRHPGELVIRRTMSSKASIRLVMICPPALTCRRWRPTVTDPSREARRSASETTQFETRGAEAIARARGSKTEAIARARGSKTHPARGNYFSAMRTSRPETMVCCGGCHLFRRARTAKRRITVSLKI